MAGTPGFSIDHSFEREQTYIPGDWNTIDTITQNYSFNWSETFSSRLELDLEFELQFEDIIRSLDVDQKTVEPTLDIFVKSYVWDFNFLAKDTIDFTNEFNIERKDAIEYGLELNFFPYFLPTFQVESQRLLDTQENLEDKVGEKLDANLEYELSDILDLSLSWKEEKTDDRLFDNSDIDSQDWEFNLDYSQIMTSSLKVDYKSNWIGRREDTLNNAGQVLNSDREHEIENNLKFTLDTFPNFDSELEITHLNDFVENGTETDIDLLFVYDQPVVDLGTLTETLTITRGRVDLGTEDTTDLDIDIDVELAGTPDQYLDYSVKYTHSLTDTKDGINPANNSDGQTDEFNFSLTMTPNVKATIENSYNWSVTRTDGTQSASSRDLKINGMFEGEMFNVPNLTFNPLLEISNEKDFESGEITDVTNLDLEFIYAFVLPRKTSWEITSVYTWEIDDDLDRSLEFTSDFSTEFTDTSWDFEFEEEATVQIEYDSDEPTTWEHDLTFTIGKELTPRFSFDTSYKYEYNSDDANADEIEADLEFRNRSTFLSLSYSRDRVFENPKDVVRVYTVEVSMDF